MSKQVPHISGRPWNHLDLWDIKFANCDPPISRQLSGGNGQCHKDCRHQLWNWSFTGQTNNPTLHTCQDWQRCWNADRGGRSRWSKQALWPLFLQFLQLVLIFTFLAANSFIGTHCYITHSGSATAAIIFLYCSVFYLQFSFAIFSFSNELFPGVASSKPIEQCSLTFFSAVVRLWQGGAAHVGGPGRKGDGTVFDGSDGGGGTSLFESWAASLWRPPSL